MNRLTHWLRQPARTATRRPAPLRVEGLEDRVVPDGGRPLPLPVIFAGAGEGGAPVVRAYDAETGELDFERAVYDTAFAGGVRVAAADFTRDGYPDLVAAPGPGGGPNVRVLDGKTGEQVPGAIGSFWAYEETFTGGLTVAAGEVDGDGVPDVITAAGHGGGPRVRVFSGADGSVIRDFFAFDPDFDGGVSVAAADVTGDGLADLAVGAGVGGAPHVKVYDLFTTAPVDGPLGSFYAFDPATRGGVSVGADALAGDADADGTFDLAVGTGPGDPAQVRVFSGATGGTLLDFAPFGAEATGGVRVALAYVSDDPYADVVVGTGPGPTATVRVFDGATGLQLPAPQGEYQPFGPGFTGGVWVAASNDPPPMNIPMAAQVTSLAPGQPIAVRVGYSKNPSLPTPTGTVDFYDYATNTKLGTATLQPGADGHAYTGIVTAALAVDANGFMRVRYRYNGDANYTAGSEAFAEATLIPGPLPADCGCGGWLGGGAGVGPSPGAATAGGVALDGTVTLKRDDLGGGAGGAPARQGWGWASVLASGTGGQTGGTTTTGMGLSLARVNPNGWAPNGSSLAVVDRGDPVAFFDKYFDHWSAPEAPTFRPRFDAPYRLTEDTANGVVEVTDGRGARYTFWDFNSANTSAGLAGRLKAVTAPGGSQTAVAAYDSSGRPTDVQTVVGSGATAVTESVATDYTANTATLRRKVGAGAWSTVRSAAYTYGTGMGSGQVKLAVVKDAAGNPVETSYYRYYPGMMGPGNLKYAFGPAAYDRLVAALGANVDALSDAQVAPYADTYLEYDSSNRATKRVAAGDGCSACSGGQGTYTYTYAARAEPFAKLPNTWVRKVVETLPDGNENTYYLNRNNDLLLRVYKDAATGQQWRWASKYAPDYRLDPYGGLKDPARRVVAEAGPSAVTGHAEALADLLGYGATGLGATHLAAGSGLVTAYQYATATSGGNVDTRLTDTLLHRGTGGAGVKQATTTYALAGDGVTVVPAATTVYRNENGTGAQTTTLSYTWQGTTALPATVTTTLPAVTTAQNGPGTATSSVIAYDALGRVAWAKDAAGSIGYTEYDPATGAAVKQITDVDTDLTATFAGLPAGWSSPAGLHLTTTYEVDPLGRTTKTTRPDGVIDYTVYNDPAREVRQYPGWTGTAPTGPTVVSREDRARGYTETLTMSAAPAVTGGRPTGAEAVSSLQSLSRSHVNSAGQRVYSDAYFNLSGLTYSTAAVLSGAVSGTHYYRAESGYTHGGYPNRSVTPQGTISRTVFDGLGRAVSEWVGTDDTPTTGSWSPANTAGTNLVKVREYEYDGGGVGDGTRTKVTEYPGLGGAARVTQTWYDWRDRAVATKAGVEALAAEQTSAGLAVNRPLTYLDLDNLGQVTKTRAYDADGVTPSDANADGVPDAPGSGLVAQAAASYDELGRVYRSDMYSVSGGAASTNTLRTDTWYDKAGRVLKTRSPGGLVTKTAYDGAGRATVTYATDGGGDPAPGAAGSWDHADDVTGDAVLEQGETAYDAGGKVLTVTSRRRFHDETATGALGTPTTGVKARVSYTGYYYDAGGRATAAVDVGTNGGTAWTRPGTVPARSDTALVTSYLYDAAGRVRDVTDPKGLVARTTYDALGRTAKTVENYVDGVVSDADDKTTEYAYNGAGMSSLTARLTGGGVQTTQWVWGVTSGAGGSGLDSNDVAGKTWWPDPSTGAASSAQQESVTVNALGQTATSTDRNGTVHTLSYDVLGRVTADAATTLGSGVDGAVRRVETAYDGQGNPFKVTTYTAASGGAVVTDVKRDYNGLGQLTADWQSHSGAVTGSTPKVGYAYSEMAGGANHSRPTSVTYPSGYVLTGNYTAGLANTISRLSSLSDTSGTVEGYDYLGLGTVVRRTRPQPGVDFTYLKLTGESNGDAGDQYIGLDRFDRVKDQRWVKTSTGVATDRFEYGYDRDSNRVYRDNLVNTVFGEVYTYDGLNQVASFARGTLNAGKTGISGTASRTQGWDYDAAGNWDSLTTNGAAQARTTNRQNEITSIAGATAPTFDPNGNMTGDETGKQFVYDAWNRLVTVKNAGGTTLETLAYDGGGRRIKTTAGGTTTDLYYSAAWQVVEEKVGANTAARYVWSPVYVDALVVRDRDTDANGTLEERLWAQQDANWNVTALVDGTGAVVERYAYDPFGRITMLDPNWANDADGASDYGWVYSHQGGRRDEVSGLYHFRNRDYSPTLGRWSSQDPIGFSGGVSNLYQAVGNDPVGTVDPTGLKGRRVGPKHERKQVEWFGRLERDTARHEGFPPIALFYFGFDVVVDNNKVVFKEEPFLDTWLNKGDYNPQDGIRDNKTDYQTWYSRDPETGNPEGVFHVKLNVEIWEDSAAVENGAWIGGGFGTVAGTAVGWFMGGPPGAWGGFIGGGGGGATVGGAFGWMFTNRYSTSYAAEWEFRLCTGKKDPKFGDIQAKFLGGEGFVKPDSLGDSVRWSEYGPGWHGAKPDANNQSVGTRDWLRYKYGMWKTRPAWNYFNDNGYEWPF
jgi:RHS repeat-associated protein